MKESFTNDEINEILEIVIPILEKIKNRINDELKPLVEKELNGTISDNELNRLDILDCGYSEDFDSMIETLDDMLI